MTLKADHKQLKKVAKVFADRNLILKGEVEALIDYREALKCDLRIVKIQAIAIAILAIIISIISNL